MLATDLNGLWTSLKTNQVFHLLILLGICILLYMMFSKYINSKNDFTNINILYGNNGSVNGQLNTGMDGYCKGNIPKLDEAIIRNAIEFKNRDPKMLTTSMVVPELSPPSDETRRRARMDILNMFYNSFDDDLTSIKARPQNLYIIP
jgi:hypothetical protein